MFLLPPDIIKLNEEILKQAENDVKAIHRLIIFSRDHFADNLLDTYLNSIDNLRELLSIKNAQMEAQTEEELEQYTIDLKHTLDYIVAEIMNQVNFSSSIQLFNLIRLIAPDVHKNCPNRYRDKDVQVGAHICPSPDEIPSLMENFFYNLQTIQNSVIRAIYAHHELVRIHPFADGNGRISRMVKNWILMYDLYPPIFIKSKEEKTVYITSLKNSFSSLESNPFTFSTATQTFFEQEIDRLKTSTSQVYSTVFQLGARTE